MKKTDRGGIRYNNIPQSRGVVHTSRGAVSNNTYFEGMGYDRDKKKKIKKKRLIPINIAGPRRGNR